MKILFKAIHIERAGLICLLVFAVENTTRVC